MKRPSSIMGDDDRVLIGAGARRTPALGVPVEIDPEQTQPPGEPPDITSLPGFDRIPAEVREALVALHNTQRELDVGMMRLWAARHVPDELRAMQGAIDALTRTIAPIGEYMRAVNSQAGQIHRIAARIEAAEKGDDRLAAALDHLRETLEALGSRVGVVERENDRFSSALRTAGEQIAELTRRTTEAIRELATKATEADRERAEETKALEVRVQSLEDTRTEARGAVRGARWAFGLVAAVIGFAAGFLGHLLGSSGHK